MAQLPAPYFPGPDRVIRKYDSLLKRNLYWYWPMSSETGNYVTLDLANYLFDTVEGTEADLLTADQLPAGARDSADSYADDLQTMADQGNRVKQSLVTGGYSMDAFPKSQKGRRKGLATIDITDYQDYGSVIETREGISLLETIDLDQQVNSSVGLSVDQFLAVASVQGVLVPYLATFNGKTTEQVARVSLATLAAALVPLLPTQISPTNPVNPTKTLVDFSIEGIDQIIEGVLDTQYRVGVIFSDGTASTITTQGKSVDGFEWTIPPAKSQGEQISLTGVLPIHANATPGDGRNFTLELRHTSLPKVASKVITIIDGTVAPPPPATTEPFIELLLDVDARSIRVRYRLGGGASRAGLVVFRDGNIIYSSDNLSTSLDTSLSQTVSPGTYYARVFEPNKDSNFLQSAPQTIKAPATGASLVTAIDYAHLAKSPSGNYPELQLWFKGTSSEAVFYTLTTEDLPETSALPTAPYTDANGYTRQQQQVNVRGGQLVTVKAWTESNPGGAISKQFRITAGASRTTVYGGSATPPVDNATIITAIDTQYAANGALTAYVKTSRGDGAQFAIANNAGQYSGWFPVADLANDSAGYQYSGAFSPAAPGTRQQIRYRPSTNSAESAIAYLTLVVPNGAQPRKTEWANGAQLQPVSGDFRIDHVDSNLGGRPTVLFRLLPIWNADGTEVTFRRTYTGQVPDGFTEYWTFDKEGLAPDPNKAVNPYQGRSIEGVIWFPPNYNVQIECFWAKGPEVNRGYEYGYCNAIGGATIYTGTKPAN